MFIVQTFQGNVFVTDECNMDYNYSNNKSLNFNSVKWHKPLDLDEAPEDLEAIDGTNNRVLIRNVMASKNYVRGVSEKEVNCYCKICNKFVDSLGCLTRFQNVCNVCDTKERYRENMKKILSLNNNQMISLDPITRLFPTNKERHLINKMKLRRFIRHNKIYSSEILSLEGIVDDSFHNIIS